MSSDDTRVNDAHTSHRTQVFKSRERRTRPWTVAFGCGCEPHHTDHHQVALLVAQHHHCPNRQPLPAGVPIKGNRSRRSHR